MNELTTGQYMAAGEVALVLGVGISTVKRTIEKLRSELGGVFELKNSQGGYMLNEAEVTLIKKQIEINPHIDNVIDFPKTELEKVMIVKQAMTILSEQVADLESKLTEAAPKIAFFDQVTNSKDAIDIGSAAKVLNIKGFGRNKLFEELRYLGLLNEDNQPYQQYVDRGYFRTIEQKYTKPDGSTHINIKTVVYQRGLDYIRKVVGA